MLRVRLVHWKPEEAAPRVQELADAGYDVVFETFDPNVMRGLAADPPDAFVIDLTRLPSHGRDVGLYVRERKATRRVPIVFLGGAPEKVARAKERLPDAVYTGWDDAAAAIADAIANPPEDPVVPESTLAGYSGTPLPKKLGIKQGAAVALVDAPTDFEQTLGKLPEGVELRRGIAGAPDVIMLFTMERAHLESNVPEMRDAMADGGRLWLAWPKKASGVVTDVSEPVVREIGLAAGLVDYKICAIDSTWSGLLFARRKGGGSG